MTQKDTGDIAGKHGVQTRYRRGDYGFHPLANGSAVFVPASGQPAAILPQQVHTLLAHCDRFRSLGEHAAELSARASVGPRATRELKEALSVLARAGLLITEQELSAALPRCPRNDAGPPPITLVGIPTADRPRRLGRALAGYLREADERGGPVRFIVMDDSRRADSQAANRSLVSSLQRRAHSVVYFGQHQREELVRRLARESGVDRSAVAFGLLPGPRRWTTTGSARNALLLLARGCLSVQMDDDAIAYTYAPPDFAGNHVLALASADPTRVYLDADGATACPGDVVLQLHQRLLGRTLPDLLSDGMFSDLHLEGLAQPTVQMLRSGDTRIRATSLGALVRTRSVSRLRVATAYTVTSAQVFSSLHLGIDGTGFLPPFLPAFRNEDLVFGSLLRRCSALVGFIPRAVVHERAGRGLRDRRSATVPNCFVGHHVLRLMGIGPRVTEPAADVIAQGRHLLALAALADRDFSALLSPLVREDLARALVTAVESHGIPPRHESGDFAPRHWHRRSRALLESALTRHQIIIEEFENFGHTTALRQLRHFAGRFGELLAVWPALLGASSSALLDELGSLPQKQ